MKNRNFYRDPATGVVYEYDDQQVESGFVLDSLVPMTAEEIEAHLNHASVPMTVEEVERLRLVAYADPITGSDRFFAEAARLQAIGGTTDEIEAARAAGAARYAEIQGQYPWPA